MKRLAELRHEASELGIITPERPLWGVTKDYLMDLLAAHYRAGASSRASLLPQLQVMGARKWQEQKPAARQALLDSTDMWIAEEKLDGVRAKLHLGFESNRTDSKHRSDKTYEYVEKTGQLPHLWRMLHSFTGTVLDGELIMPVERIKDGKTNTDSYLTSTIATVNSSPKRAIELQEKFGYCRYFVFDMLYYRGQDIRQYPYSYRYAELTLLRETLPTSFIKMPTRCCTNFTTFRKRLIAGGGEGIMLKHLNGLYEGGKYSKYMLKWKKHKDMDCFITGFVPGENEFSGLVGSLLVSIIHDEKAIEVGAVQPGSLDFRRSISLGDGSLRDDMYGKVLEVTYLCKTKNGRLRHAAIGEKGFRTDKTCWDCTGG